VITLSPTRLATAQYDAGYTTQMLAVDAAIPYRALLDIKSGRREATMTELQNIADTLGIHPGRLLVTLEPS
jgi:hypothetical protein